MFMMTDLELLIALWRAYKNSGRNEDRQKVEAELSKYIGNNQNISKEDLYFISCGHAIGITFIPTSKSYEDCGEHITVTKIIVNDVEQKTLINNLFEMIKGNNPVVQPTYGKFEAEIFASPNKVVFDTRDIAKILRCG